MPLIIQRNDLTKMEVDAIVLPANPWLEEGAGTSRAIYNAAGAEELALACQKFGYVDYGNSVITDGFALPARNIIHSVVPLWVEGDKEVPKQLYNCYMSALKLAARSGLMTIAFPLLSSGRFRYPKVEALQIANRAIVDFLSLETVESNENDFMGSYATEPTEMTVYLVVYDNASVEAAVNIYGDIKSYIDDRYVEELDAKSDVEMGNFELEEMRQPVSIAEPFKLQKRFTFAGATTAKPEAPLAFEESGESVAGSITNEELDDIIKRQTETFSDALLRFVNASGMTNPEIYNKANISKQQFSRIITGVGYTPKKSTILALAIGLKLDLKDTKYLLMKAGYALSDSSKQDIIVSYFIEHGIYNIFDINIALFNFGENLLGSAMG